LYIHEREKAVMKKIRTIVFAAAAAMVALCAAARADSPITSTDFFNAYLDIDIVRKAHERGVMDLEIAQYLSSPENPIDVKAAVVNALTWDFNGKSNAVLYSYYLALKYGTTVEKLRLTQMQPDEMLCYGYLLVLDDYFNPKESVAPLEIASYLKPMQNTGGHEMYGKSFTAAIIRALAEAQVAFDTDWCRVWTLTDSVFSDKILVRDMRPEAVAIIKEYMDMYSGECK
jgi:hypothetical protein